MQRLQSPFLEIDVTEIVVHEAHQPDTVVDFFDTHRLTCERSAEIDFLFVNADSSAAGDQRCFYRPEFLSREAGSGKSVSGPCNCEFKLIQLL